MQLQRSLFSFYNVFVRKVPLAIWFVMTITMIMIIGWEINQIQKEQQVYQFQKCIQQYYNYTRITQAQWINQNNKKIQNGTQNVNDTTGTGNQPNHELQNQVPFNLRPQYYKILNKTTTIKIYLSDSIQYKQNEPNCRIILNTQKIKTKTQQQKQTQTIQQNQDSAISKDTTKNKGPTILQQIDIDDQKINDQNKQTEEEKDDAQQKQVPIINQPQKPINLKKYDQISNQQKQYLINQHPFFHISGNSHIVYLNQDNPFQQKHNVKIHSLILSKQIFNFYPQTLFGMVSSKLWRFHGNQQITRNQMVMKSIVKSFDIVNNKIKQRYKTQVQRVNKQISQAKLANDTKSNTDGSTNQTQNNNSVKINGATTLLAKQGQINSSKDENSNNTNKLPSKFIIFQDVQPLSQIKLYFHYPQIIRYEQLLKLVMIIQQNNGFFFNFFFLILVFTQYVILSALIGLFLRYLFIWIITLYLFAGGCLINQQWGWVFKYFNLIRNRNYRENNTLLVSSFKMLAFFTLALIGMLTIFTLGSKYILQNLYIYSMTFSQSYYSYMILKNLFLIELYYYVCCRSRISLKFFPLFSLKISFLIVFLSLKFYFYNISWLINLHMWAHLLLMCIFSMFENKIGSSIFYNQFTPSIQKPRALYYVGYDISWQNTIPPIWTYFTTYFDLKHFDQRQMALLERDYQLLYGRLLGMNDRQQLPEDEQIDNQDQVHKLNQNLSQNNQMDENYKMKLQNGQQKIKNLKRIEQRNIKDYRSEVMQVKTIQNIKKSDLQVLNVGRSSKLLFESVIEQIISQINRNQFEITV